MHFGGEFAYPFFEPSTLLALRISDQVLWLGMNSPYKCFKYKFNNNELTLEKNVWSKKYIYHIRPVLNEHYKSLFSTNQAK